MTTGLEQYIRQAARARGIDEDIAVRVARSEGLRGDSYIRSEYTKNGSREPSYGPFQLLVGGQGTGFPEGMGNQMIRETGIDPRDPANAYKGIDFALDQARNVGWGQWYGARGQGITGKMGIGGAPVGSPPSAPSLPDGPKGQEAYAPPVMGSMAPTMMAGGSSAPATPTGPIPAEVTAQATQQNPMASIFGAMMAQQDQGPQFSPVQIQGPSPEQSMALANFIKSLTGRMA